MSFSEIPIQLEPLELHVVEALGQQDVQSNYNNLQGQSQKM